MLATLLAWITLTLVHPQSAQAAETADWLPFQTATGVVQVGYTWSPNDGGLPNHTDASKGIDFIAPVNTSVYAGGPGQLVGHGGCHPTNSIGCNTNAGNYVTITHPDGRVSRYLHLASIARANGPVGRGDLIGYTGNSGTDPAVSPPHLHYDESVNGAKIDPGLMNAMHGTTLVQYPGVLNTSYTSWNQVPAWTNKWVRNDSFNSGGSVIPTGASPIQNGGFNSDTSHWSVGGTANLAHYTANSNMGTLPYEGSGFAATNASQAGDSFYETNTASIAAGTTFCAEAQVVTVGNATGGSGTLAVWLLGGSTNDVSTFDFSNLAGGNNWKPVKTCVTATTGHTLIRTQLYPTPGAPTIGVDAIDVHRSLASNSGFNVNGAWQVTGANYARYAASSNVGTNPYEGSAFGATNTQYSGGGIYQDTMLAIGPGDTFCAESQVVTVGNTSGGGGALAIWLIGTTTTEGSSVAFSNLAGGNNWKPVKTCVRATGAHTTVRIQVYPNVNGPTIGLDATEMHASLIQNGGFNGNSAHWSPSGTLGYAPYANYNGTTPYEGSGFEVVQAQQANDSLLQTRSWSIGTGDTFCIDARIVTAGVNTGGSGRLAVWLLGGTSPDVSVISFNNLPNLNGWTPMRSCVMATSPHTSIRAQIYPDPTSPPLGIDAVDVH